MKIITSSFFSFLLLYSICHAEVKDNIVINGGKIVIEFNSNMESRVISGFDNNKIVLTDFSSSEYILSGGRAMMFRLSDYEANDYRDSLDNGREYVLTGTWENISKTISIISYNSFPTVLFYTVSYKNNSDKDFSFDSWANNKYNIVQKPASGKPAFWSYQPGSYGWDNNWILPLEPGFKRENYLGMTYEDYGGGTPVADVWRKDYGIAVGHVEKVPELVSLPVSMNDNGTAQLAVTCNKKIILKPGESFTTFRTFVQVHKGDSFNSLTVYRQFMEKQGFEFKDAPEDAYGTEWCGWGYEQNFTMEQINNTLPKVKELGLDWVVLDMGWYKGAGDYYLPDDKFPNGVQDIINFVKNVHSYGLKVQLWWLPLAAEPGTDLYRDHKDYLILNQDNKPHYMPSFFKSYFLCPADKQVQEYSRRLVEKFINWGFDGLKIDGNNQNSVPLCYNPEHHHSRPEESAEAIPAFYKLVYETALRLNKNAKMQICPCGTNQSFFLMPYMNETVASDPHNSWQVRLKGKTLKALTGSKAVFYGDHVELSDNKSDFASTIGVGGTIGTKFVYPPGVHMNSESGDVSLTPEKEKTWKKWITIYNNNMLSKGIYRGELYDIGFDRPEAHAVQKGDIMYYAFYAPEYSGSVELRGLENKKYKITDYENNKELGFVNGPAARLNVSFNTHLLIKAEVQ